MTQQAEPSSETENRWSFGAALGSGRTSVRRGLIALLVAPALTVLPLSLLFLAFVVGAPWEEGIPMSENPAGVLLLLEIVFGMVAGVTIVFGGPTWIVLRWLHMESARAYVLAGMVEGLLWARIVLYSGVRALTVEQVMAFGLASVVGGVAALGFWLIARPKWGSCAGCVVSLKPVGTSMYAGPRFSWVGRRQQACKIVQAKTGLSPKTPSMYCAPAESCPAVTMLGRCRPAPTLGRGRSKPSQTPKGFTGSCGVPETGR